MSSISGCSIDWTQWEPISKQNNNAAVETAENTQATTNPIYQGQVEETAGDQFVVSQSGETCTDGNDDGKISLWSKVGNTLKGIGKGAVNMVKSAVQHPIKTALMVGACCIPVVGPAIAIGLGAYGVYQGGKTIVNGMKAANAATTDAEAKEAWQNVGNGTFTTAASALAIKGGAGVLKGQISAIKGTAAAEGSGAANLANLAKATEGGLKNAGLKQIGKAALKDTGANAGAIAKGIKETGKKGLNKVKEGAEYVKETTVNGNVTTGTKSSPKIKTEAQYNELKSYISQQEKNGSITSEAADIALKHLENNYNTNSLNLLQRLIVKRKPSNILKAIQTPLSKVIDGGNTIIDTKLPISDEVLMYSSVLDSEG